MRLPHHPRVPPNLRAPLRSAIFQAEKGGSEARRPRAALARKPRTASSSGSSPWPRCSRERAHHADGRPVLLAYSFRGSRGRSHQRGPVRQARWGRRRGRGRGSRRCGHDAPASAAPQRRARQAPQKLWPRSSLPGSAKSCRPAGRVVSGGRRSAAPPRGRGPRPRPAGRPGRCPRERKGRLRGGTGRGRASRRRGVSWPRGLSAAGGAPGLERAPAPRRAGRAGSGPRGRGETGPPGPCGASLTAIHRHLPFCFKKKKGDQWDRDRRPFPRRRRSLDLLSRRLLWPLGSSETRLIRKPHHIL